MQTGVTFAKPWKESKTATFELPSEQSAGIYPEVPSWSIRLALLSLSSSLSSWISEWAGGTRAISQEVERLLSQLIENQVSLIAPDEIRRYLRNFPDLIELVPVAIEAARRYLPEAELSLQVYHDPEIDDSYLAIYVRVRKYDESVMERIEQAEAEFLDLLMDKSGWLQLTTDFKEAGGTHGL